MLDPVILSMIGADIFLIDGYYIFMLSNFIKYSLIPFTTIFSLSILERKKEEGVLIIFFKSKLIFKIGS